MLVVVSPAKRLNETAALATGGTVPRFGPEALALVETARGIDAGGLERLMRLSPKLAALNVARFAEIGAGAKLKQARELFAGDTYTGLDAGSLDAEEIAYAQRHLRILSGLYGLLRPCDEIAPHRLEMGTRLATAAGRDLYAFWGDRIAEALVADAAAVGTDVLVNCASVEYFTAADRPALTLRVITPRFLEDRPEGPKVVSFWAKQARGALARFIVQRRLRDPAALAEFDSGGYRYQPGLSTPEAPVFLRPAQAENAAALG